MYLEARIEGESNVVSIAASDFNYDGRLDLLLVKNTTNFTKQMKIYFGNTTHFCKNILGTLIFYTRNDIPKNIADESVELKEEAKDQVMIFDSNGDMQMDLLGTDPVTNENVVWLNNFGNFTM